MKKSSKIGLLVATALLLAAMSSHAAAPRKINYQGYLTNPAGAPLTGTFPMVFSLCDAVTAGACPWTETQSVAIDKGIFNVALGAVTPLTLPFDTPYFLDIQVNGEQMSARQPLTSVGYAFMADTASNVTGAASLNVLKAGDTMTGNLVMANSQLRLQDVSGSKYVGVQAPAALTASYTLTLPADAGTAGKVLSTDGAGNLSWSAGSAGALLNGGNAFGAGGSLGTTDNFGLNIMTNNATRLQIGNTGTVAIPAFATSGVVHNDASGNLSSSMVANADISAAAGITDTKLATISTAGKVANSATTATNANTANTIVARDASGNFFAGNITANLSGNAMTATALAANGSNCPAGSYAMGVDASGNAEGCTVAGGSADTIAPVPGGSGTITAASGTDIALSWTAATDNVTPQSNLEYTVFYSKSNNINTVANAEANGTVFGFPWSTNITSKTVTGLTVGTTYYFNVAVKDAGLNKVMYTTVSKVPSVSTTNIILYGSGTAAGGNLGGRSGANALCSANKPAGFTNYAAFLSVSGSDSIAGREAFSGLDTSRSVRSINGTLIANNWSDLLDGTISTSLLAAGISVPSHYWWSGSNADGTVGLTCSGWTSSVNPASGSDPSGDWGTDGNTSSLWIYPGAIDRTYCETPTDVLCIAW